MDTIFSKLGGTKFLLSILVIGTATVMLAYGKLDGSQYSQLVGAVAGLFMAGNAVATFGNAKLETAKRCNPE